MSKTYTKETYESLKEKLKHVSRPEKQNYTRSEVILGLKQNIIAWWKKNWALDEIVKAINDVTIPEGLTVTTSDVKRIIQAYKESHASAQLRYGNKDNNAMKVLAGMNSMDNNEKEKETTKLC